MRRSGRAFDTRKAISLRFPRLSASRRDPASTLLGQPLPLDPSLLARIAPAVERPGVHLGVHRIAKP